MEWVEAVLCSTGASEGQIEIYTMCHRTNFMAVLLLHVLVFICWQWPNRCSEHSDVVSK